ncbi:MAG: tyrosine-type recombinase/integrase [Deltaproteobacteria bacterium]|nr:tyrosine-type recombinase/integrase [Deltaproteobacteria bacterium]
MYPLSNVYKNNNNIIKIWLNTLNSRRTRDTYGESVRLAFKFMKRLHSNQVTIEDVAAFKQSMSGKRPATVALRLSALRSYFKFVVANNYATFNPTLNVPIPRIRHNSPRAITFKEAKTITEQINLMCDIGKRDVVAIALLFGGLRVSEVARLNIGDISLEQQDHESFTRVRVIGKGAKPRVVDLPQHVYNLVLRYIETRDDSINTNSPLLIAKISGYRKTSARMSADRIYRQFRRYARKAKVKITGSHVGRHTWAKLAEEGGAKLMDVMEHLGHANLNVTANYLRRLSGRRNPAYSCVPSLV